MAMPATTIWTADMVRALPDDGKRYEVIDGEVFVTPSPVLLHQRAAFALGMLLSGYDHGREALRAVIDRQAAQTRRARRVGGGERLPQRFALESTEREKVGVVDRIDEEISLVRLPMRMMLPLEDVKRLVNGGGGEL
jgi:hypothetical protein